MKKVRETPMKALLRFCSDYIVNPCHQFLEHLIVY